MIFQETFMGKKILITGDTGFKGSWLALWLTELGAEVFGYALPPKHAEDNFNSCKLASLFPHQDGDIRDFESFLQYVRKIQPDIMFHLAAQPIVLESYQNPKYTFETNVLGTVNFFEAVRSVNSIKVAVNITSDKCYQNNEWIWGYRENDPMGGKDPYSASKGCAELVTSAYQYSFFSSEKTCAIASVRAGNVIGGGDWAEDRIVPDFFRSIRNNHELVLRNPRSTRPWQFVLEPLSGYLQLASLLYREGKNFSGGWNFGPGNIPEHTVQDLITAIIARYGKGSIHYKPNHENLHEATLLKLDISKAMTLLQWMPVLTFDEVVEFTVHGYRIELDSKDVLASRKEQLRQYTRLAKTRKIAWAAYE